MEDIWAAAVAELHPPETFWKRAKIGDRVQLLDGWAVNLSFYKGGIGKVKYIEGEPLINDHKGAARLGIVLPGVTDGWAWAYNTHVREIID